MVGVWSVAEPCLGIVAACLPTMGSFVRKALQQLAELRNGLSHSWSMKRTADNSSTWAAISIDRAYNDLQSLQDSDAEVRMDTYITSGERPKASAHGQAPNIPLNAIEVNTTTTWTDKWMRDDSICSMEGTYGYGASKNTSQGSKTIPQGSSKRATIPPSIPLQPLQDLENTATVRTGESHWEDGQRETIQTRIIKCTISWAVAAEPRPSDTITESPYLTRQLVFVGLAFF